MSDNKRTYRLTLVVKKATVEFSPGMGEGVLASQEVTYSLPPNVHEYQVEQSLRDEVESLIRDIVHVHVELLKE